MYLLAAYALGRASSEADTTTAGTFQRENSKDHSDTVQGYR
jgi:hypothetical protein